MLEFIFSLYSKKILLVLFFVGKFDFFHFHLCFWRGKTCPNFLRDGKLLRQEENWWRRRLNWWHHWGSNRQGRDGGQACRHHQMLRWNERGGHLPRLRIDYLQHQMLRMHRTRIRIFPFKQRSGIGDFLQLRRQRILQWQEREWINPFRIGGDFGHPMRPSWTLLSGAQEEFDAQELFDAQEESEHPSLLALWEVPGQLSGYQWHREAWVSRSSSPGFGDVWGGVDWSGREKFDFDKKIFLMKYMI